MLVEQALHAFGQFVDERDLDEDQRLCRHAGMKEGVAAAIGVEPVLEILPGADLVHGFIFDELFQQRGRRVPGNALQFQEADIEPRREPVLEFAIERLQFLVVPQEAQQIDAHVDKELDALGNGIELGEDADAPRAHGHAQPSLGVPLSRRTDRALIGLVGPGHLLGIRAELERDQAQEAMPPLVVKLEIGLRKPHCPLSGRYFSAQSFHAVGQLGADLVEEARRQLGRILAGNHPADGRQASADKSVNHWRASSLLAGPSWVRRKCHFRPLCMRPSLSVQAAVAPLCTTTDSCRRIADSLLLV